MSKSHLIYLILVLVVIALLMGWLLALTPFIQPFMQPLTQAVSVVTGGTRSIQLKGNNISVSIADTDAERQLGLGGRASLGADEGMLFIFPADGKYAFWMKDMHFSIDMLWLTADGTIVHIAPNVAPDTYPKTFVSSAPARDVLELPAGYAVEHSVNVGDKVQL